MTTVTEAAINKVVEDMNEAIENMDGDLHSLKKAVKKITSGSLSPEQTRTEFWYCGWLNSQLKYTSTELNENLSKFKFLVQS